MLAHAQDLVDNLKELMPTKYQKENLETMLGLFLEAQGHPLPEHSQTKSSSALSRFLNINPWSTRDLIRTVRHQILETVLKTLSESSPGRRPFLQVIVDLTTLEKRGKFKEFEHLISVYNGKRGLHLPPDWGNAAQTALELLFPNIVVSLILLDIQRLIPLARSCGFDISISRCKM